MSSFKSLLGKARDRASGGNLNVHEHVCGIYDHRDDQFEPACIFLKSGLDRGEQCLYIAEHLKPSEFKALLERHGVNVADLIASGALMILSGREMRLKLGGFTPESMLTFLAQSERKALQAGFSAFRLAADMTWLQKDNIAPADLFLYEAELNLLLSQRRIVGLCQYARDDFKAELLVAAAETHPILVYKEIACDNFYYVPPEEYLKQGASELKLTRFLFNIVTRERLMHYMLTRELPRDEDNEVTESYPPRTPP